MKTTNRKSLTRSESWCYPQPHSCTLQTKFISSLDLSYIKFRPKNDQTEAQHLFLIIFCICFSTFKKPADPNSKKNQQNWPNLGPTPIFDHFWYFFFNFQKISGPQKIKRLRNSYKNHNNSFIQYHRWGNFMEKSDSDIPRVDLYRKTIVVNEKKTKKYKKVKISKKLFE